MSQVGRVFFDNYTPAGDVAVTAICILMAILLLTSYVNRTRSFKIFIFILSIVAAASWVNIAYHLVMAGGNPALHGLVYILRILYHALLYWVFSLFVLYTTVISEMNHHKARIAAITATVLFVGVLGFEIIWELTSRGFRILEDGKVVNSSNIFMIGYVLFSLLLVALVSQVRNLVYKRVMYGFYGAIGIAFVIQFTQMALNQSALTTMTFLFPVIAMFYIMHSTPYNITLGTVDVRAMEDMVRTMHGRDREFLFLSLYLPDYDNEGKELPVDIQAVVRRFAINYFRGCFMFQIGNGHILLMASKRRNPDYERRTRKILEDFKVEYEHFRVPFKIVIGESMEEISRKNEYASLIRSIHRTMAESTYHRVNEEDIARFNRYEYILSELTDIYNKKDVNDPRVLAFCQPVYNIKTESFDTAEALMRLKLDKIGLVYPDQFIPVAERHGYIHVLTEIILNKTCNEIRKLYDEGFQISRISVNVSVLELKDNAFCSDIRDIIHSNDISGDKIALELTESRSDADFLIMKEKINELHEQGIKFYLDDFGTGYSSMEKIMELPFDIIKFDRSLVIASGTNPRSEKIVENLAHMFQDMEYSVLYEGVENDIDEERCREMSASYLQGYKYSRPVPIEQLREFLPKSGSLQ